MINNDRYFDESNGRFASYNQSKRLLNRWKKPGDITDIPRHGVYTEFDDRLLEDASFLRLKNLMLSYSFPQEWLRKTRFISGVKIYAQAQNLFTFTKFTGPRSRRGRAICTRHSIRWLANSPSDST